MVREIYFDSASTTKVYPQVIKEMNKCMLYDYGNPSSAHALGDNASKLIVSARTNIARVIGVKPHEIYFTSGTTESNNWIFSGLAHSNPGKKKIIISSIEHPSIRETANLFKNWGYQIIEIPVDSQGFVDLEFIKKNIGKDVLFVSVIHGNNIFGTIQNLKKIGDICKKNGVFFHTDAAQTFGKMKILAHDWNVDLLSASAHKLGGPKGVGFLYVRDGVKFSALIHGGGQEKGLRSGTENVAGIVGFAKAVEISLNKNWNEILKIRDYLIKELEGFGGKLVGSKSNRVLSNLFISFPKIEGERLIYDLSAQKIYVSRGSACDSKKEIEDYALKSIGLNSDEIKGAIRISLPVDTTKKDADYFLKVLKSLINNLDLKGIK